MRKWGGSRRGRSFHNRRASNLTAEFEAAVYVMTQDECGTHIPLVGNDKTGDPPLDNRRYRSSPSFVRGCDCQSGGTRNRANFA